MGMVAIILAGVALAGLFTGAYVQYRESRKISDKLDSWGEQITEFFEAPAEGELSPFAQTVNNVANVIGQANALSTTAAIRGSLGGQQKQVNEGLEAIGHEVAPDTALADFMPKKLKKNKAAAAAVEYVLNQFMTRRGQQQTSAGNGHNDNQFDFKV